MSTPPQEKENTTPKIAAAAAKRIPKSAWKQEQALPNSSLDLLANLNFVGVESVPTQQTSLATAQEGSAATNNISISTVLDNAERLKSQIKTNDECQQTIAEKNREIQKLKAQAVDSAQRILTTTNAAIVFGNNIKLKEDQLTAVNEQLKKANEELAAAKKVESGRNQLIKQFEHKIAVFEKEKLSLTHQIENYKTHANSLQARCKGLEISLAEAEANYNDLEEKYDAVVEENVELKMDSEEEGSGAAEEKTAMQQRIKELEEQLQYTQQEKKISEARHKSSLEEVSKNLEAKYKSKLNDLQQQNNNLNTRLKATWGELESAKKELVSVKNKLVSVKKENEQLNSSTSRNTASSSSSSRPSRKQSSLPSATTDQKVLKRLRIWKVQMDTLRAENKYLKQRNAQLSEQIANTQGIDTLLASSSSEAEEEMHDALYTDFNLGDGIQDIMMEEIDEHLHNPPATSTTTIGISLVNNTLYGSAPQSATATSSQAPTASMVAEIIQATTAPNDTEIIQTPATPMGTEITQVSTAANNTHHKGTTAAANKSHHKESTAASNKLHHEGTTAAANSTHDEGTTVAANKSYHKQTTKAANNFQAKQTTAAATATPSPTASPRAASPKQLTLSLMAATPSEISAARTSSSPVQLALPPQSTASPVRHISVSPKSPASGSFNSSPSSNAQGSFDVRRRSSSGSSISSRSSRSSTLKSPQLSIPREKTRPKYPGLDPTPGQRSTNSPGSSSIKSTNASSSSTHHARAISEELFEINETTYRSSSGLIPPPPNITPAAAIGLGKKVVPKRVNPNSKLAKFAHSSNPSKVLKNNKALVLNTRASPSSSPASPSASSSSIASSPIMSPPSPSASKRAFSATSLDEMDDESLAAASPPPATTTTAEDAQSSKKQKVESNKYLKEIENWHKSGTLPPDSEITVLKLDSYIKEISNNYHQIKTALDPDVKKITFFGLKDQFGIYAPGVWDKREKLYAWFLAYAASKNDGNFDFIMRKLSNEIIHGIKVKKLEGANVRLVRLATLVCKSMNNVDTMKKLIYDIIRWSGKPSNVVAYLMNIGTAWKEPLAVNERSDYLTRSIQVCTNYIAKKDATPNITKSMYGKLMQVVGWRDSSVSMTNFITQGLESLKFRKENGLDLEEEAPKIVKSFEIIFKTLDDWTLTYNKFLLEQVWPFMNCDRINIIALEVIGTLACLGKSEDVFVEDNAGVDAIKAILEKVVNSEDDSEEGEKLKAIARKCLLKL